MLLVALLLSLISKKTKARLCKPQLISFGFTFQKVLGICTELLPFHCIHLILCGPEGGLIIKKIVWEQHAWAKFILFWVQYSHNPSRPSRALICPNMPTCLGCLLLIFLKYYSNIFRMKCSVVCWYNVRKHKNALSICFLFYYYLKFVKNCHCDQQTQTSRYVFIGASSMN